MALQTGRRLILSTRNTSSIAKSEFDLSIDVGQRLSIVVVLELSAVVYASAAGTEAWARVAGCAVHEETTQTGIASRGVT